MARSRLPLPSQNAAFLQTEQSSAGRALLNALDINGAAVSDMPLKFAEKVVARSAKQSGRVAAKAPLGTFLQAGEQQPSATGKEGSYQAQSTAIFGIMNQMQTDMEAELSRAQKEETAAQASFNQLSTTKMEQIALGKKKLDEYETAHAENIKALSDAKEDLELTRDQRSKDVEFLRNVKLQCDDLDHKWEQRSKTRSAELTAVAETIAILTEDDARELMAKSVTLLQEEASTNSVRRAHAVEALQRAAQNPTFEADDLIAAWAGRSGKVRTVGAAAGPKAQLSTLAVSVQLDSFTKVKEMMDKMVAELKSQQTEEVEFKSWCNKEFDLTEKNMFNKNEEKKDLEAKIEQLALLMKQLAKEIDEANAQIADTELEIKKASQNREKANAEFQSIVADQRATQAILKKALTRLQDFYTKKKGAKVPILAQQTPPVQFNDYKANSGSSPVMGMLEQIIGDSNALEAEATGSEYKAQADYETFVKDSNALIKELSNAVNAKTKAIADAKVDTAEANSDLQSAVGELGSLAEYEADLHAQCDFVLKNFEIRQKARLQEMEAIAAAKEILSGAQTVGS